LQGLHRWSFAESAEGMTCAHSSMRRRTAGMVEDGSPAAWNDPVVLAQMVMAVECREL
jgi:hypothetical protein